MRIECVVVCVSYSDFLCWTLPTTKQHFDRMVVVTTPADKATQKLCEYWHVQCLQTDEFYADGSAFNKGRGINVGLKALDGDGWVVHMDADIFLPPQFRYILEPMELDEDGLYHMDRLMCDDFLDWLRFYTCPVIQNENNIYVHLRPFEVGVRLAKREYGSWLPLGYFQMWNQAKKRLAYPTQHTDAARSDLQFSLNFSRSHRHMLAEMLAIHLETKAPQDNTMGANWFGRRTPPFGAGVLYPVPAVPI